MKKFLILLTICTAMLVSCNQQTNDTENIEPESTLEDSINELDENNDKDQTDTEFLAYSELPEEELAYINELINEINQADFLYDLELSNEDLAYLEELIHQPGFLDEFEISEEKLISLEQLIHQDDFELSEEELAYIEELEKQIEEFNDMLLNYEITSISQLEEPKAGETIAIIKTNHGDITVKFLDEFAPLAVENFITHAKDGYYDGLIFHRVIPDFVIQGGDPLGNGMGGESIYGEPFKLEIHKEARHFKGALAMANSGLNTNGSQFYFVVGNDVTDDIMEYYEADLDTVQNVDENGNEYTTRNYMPPIIIDAYKEVGGIPYLDFGYTVFGQIIDGLDVAIEISNVEIDPDLDKPVEDVIIESIEITTF